MRTLSIVIPTYNERATIVELLARVRAAPVCGLERELVVIDDGSSDGTSAILAREAAAGALKLVRKPENHGKGAALRDGFRVATGEILLVQDADLEYDPRDYPRLLRPILDGRADVVYGTRFSGGAGRFVDFRQIWANHALTCLSNLATGMALTDVCTGYKVFRAQVVKPMILSSNRFEFEQEVTVKIARLGCRVHEVPIGYCARGYADGKKITWRDGVRKLGSLVRYALVERALGFPISR